MALHTVNKGSISRQRDLFDVNALGTLRDPVRVESLRPVVEPRPHGEGWSIASRLLTRDDGAQLEPEPSLLG
jgi:hypothetical protein